MGAPQHPTIRPLDVSYLLGLNLAHLKSSVAHAEASARGEGRNSGNGKEGGGGKLHSLCSLTSIRCNRKLCTQEDGWGADVCSVASVASPTYEI